MKRILFSLALGAVLFCSGCAVYAPRAYPPAGVAYGPAVGWGWGWGYRPYNYYGYRPYRYYGFGPRRFGYGYGGGWRGRRW